MFSWLWSDTPTKPTKRYKKQQQGTIKVTSILEAQLRIGQWDDVRFYLNSPEGCKEVQQDGGLVTYQGKNRIVTPPLWTAVFHRAPVDIVRKIHGILNFNNNNGNVSNEEDLFHVALESPTRNDKRRSYDPLEYLDLIKFLTEICPRSSFTLKTNTFRTSKVQRKYTPLGHAVSNHKVPASIVQYICFHSPESIDVDCVFRDESYDYDISVLALSIGQNEKRDLILRGSNFYKHNGITWSKETFLPPPDNTTIEKALKTAGDNGEWDAVKDVLPLLWYNNGVEPEWVTLLRGKMEGHYETKQRSAESRANYKQYLGLVMYDYDIMADLVSSVMPRRRKRRDSNPDNHGYTRTGGMMF